VLRCLVLPRGKGREHGGVYWRHSQQRVGAQVGPSHAAEDMLPNKFTGAEVVEYIHLCYCGCGAHAVGSRCW
jgi:hypothetical protein